jgi:hypothetical protein
MDCREMTQNKTGKCKILLNQPFCHNSAIQIPVRIAPPITNILFCHLLKKVEQKSE